MQAGRWLKDEDKPVLASTSFDLWLHNVTEYLLKNFGHELAAQWQGMADSACLVRGGHYYDDDRAWNAFHGVIDQRLQWLGNLPATSRTTQSRCLVADFSYLDGELKSRCLPIIDASPDDPKVWDSAVRTAGVILEDRLRAVGRIKEDVVGRDLVNKVFGRAGTLTKEFVSDSEREGWRDLFAGVVGAFRNPSAHRLIDPNPQEGGAFIIFVNLLLSHLGKFGRPALTTAKAFLDGCPPKIAEFFGEILGESTRQGLQIKFATKGFSIRAPGTPCFFYCYPPGAMGRPNATIEIYLKDIADTDPGKNTEMRVRLLELDSTEAGRNYTIRMSVSEKTLNDARSLWQRSLCYMSIDGRSMCATE